MKHGLFVGFFWIAGRYGDGAAHTQLLGVNAWCFQQVL